MASFFHSLVLIFLVLGTTCDYDVLVSGRILSQEVEDITFIRTSCSTTLYPKLCFASLETYANKVHNNQTELVLVAMTVSLDAAQSASAWVSNLTTELWSSSTGKLQLGVMKDCVENIKMSVIMLKQSIGEMEHPSELSQGSVLGDLKTWVSAALTDEHTCMGGFSGQTVGGELKDMVRAKVTNLARLTSIALDFINRIPSSKK